MASIAAFIACTRFGFGAKKSELSMVSSDPPGWLDAQLNIKYAHNADFAGKSTAESVQEMTSFIRKKKLLKGDSIANPEALKEMLQTQGKEYLADAARRTRAAADSEAPFFERLVQFWSNHFTVSSTKKQQMAIVADFEREAIRPRILGSFHELLRASTRHPAMLIYLDNRQSVGPGSFAGKIKSKGLNENLAREILELHTLGVNGGYSQNDVTEFAKILTGWTIDASGSGDGFRFARMIHEPGEKTLLGKTYREEGVNEGERALAAFAQHPSTARFIATKLARHFIADDPPESAVRKLATTFTRNNGELLPVYQTLIGMEETWADPLAKVKTPNDYMLSLLRATGVAKQVGDLKIVGGLKMLGQVPFSAPSPAGWSDHAKDWIGAEALLQRIDIAEKVAGGIHSRTNPEELLEQTIGPVASAETKFAVKRAGSAEEGITLLFASPEFQRR